GETKVVTTFTVTFAILPELLENPAATTSTGSQTQSGNTTIDLSGLTAAANFSIATCDFFDTPSDISFVPSFAQATFQAAVQNETKPASCSSFSTQDMDRALAALKTDQDQDGVDVLFEDLYGTKDTSVDTNSDGQSDFDFVQSQFHQQQSANPGT